MGYQGRKFSFQRIPTTYAYCSSGSMMKVTGILFFFRTNRLAQMFYTSPLSIHQQCWCLSLSGSLVMIESPVRLNLNCILVAMTRGQDTEGAVPANTTIIFAVGGWDCKSQRNITLWRPGMNTVSIQTPGIGLKARRQQKRWRYRWHFLWLTNLGAKTWDQVAHWKQFGADGIDLDLETGAGDQPVSQMNFEHPHSFFFPTILILSSFWLSWFFLCSGSWREHVLLHWETSQLSSWLHHHPANLWLSSGGLNEFFLPS